MCTFFLTTKQFQEKKWSKTDSIRKILRGLSRSMIWKPQTFYIFFEIFVKIMSFEDTLNGKKKERLRERLDTLI